MLPLLSKRQPRNAANGKASQMAYTVKIIEAPETVVSNPHAFLYGLVQFLEATRFLITECQVWPDKPRCKAFLTLSKIRLKASKPYCGNHPGPCALSGHRPEKKGRSLEGADWISFNEAVNSYLDTHQVEALVTSRPLELRKPLIIRKGRLRRVHYGCSYPFANGNAVWEAEGLPQDYQDCIGRIAPPSEFPEKTPGIYTGVQLAEAH